MSDCQGKDNLSIFYSFIDSASTEIIHSLPAGSKFIKLDLTLGTAYSVFANRVIEDFKNKRINISNNNQHDTLINAVNITIEKAGISYKDMFRKNFFGSFYVPRYFNLSGSYSIIGKSTLVKRIQYAYIDTVDYDQVKNLQNISYPFTESEIPAEPFISSFWEPIVAIGATALTVILFFTIRSK
ncbi:MAG: hypothetical protein ACYDA4_07385 [Ignavibacteriaceae bacterium]